LGHQIVSQRRRSAQPDQQPQRRRSRDPLLFRRQQANFMVKLDYCDEEPRLRRPVPIFAGASSRIWRRARRARGRSALEFTDAVAFLADRIEAENATSASAQITS
jgi:hypothetical protein